MNITITANDQSIALRNYVNEQYGMKLDINPEGLKEIQVEVLPLSLRQPELQEDDREWAETRANELGINFRSDIKTSTLITRIVETEEELTKQAKNPDPLPMDEPDYEETQYEEVQEEVTETEEDIKDEPEAEEKPVHSKKPSIFDTKR